MPYPPEAMQRAVALITALAHDDHDTAARLAREFASDPRVAESVIVGLGAVAQSMAFDAARTGVQGVDAARSLTREQLLPGVQQLLEFYGQAAARHAGDAD